MSELEPATDSVRKSRLAQAIQQEVVAGGRVETQGDFNAVIRFGGKPVNHVLHGVLTFLTFGLFVWVIMYVMYTTSNKTVSLLTDDFGNVLRQNV